MLARTSCWPLGPVAWGLPFRLRMCGQHYKLLGIGNQFAAHARRVPGRRGLCRWRHRTRGSPSRAACTSPTAACGFRRVPSSCDPSADGGCVCGSQGGKGLPRKILDDGQAAVLVPAMPSRIAGRVEETRGPIASPQRRRGNDTVACGRRGGAKRSCRAQGMSRGAGPNHEALPCLGQTAIAGVGRLLSAGLRIGT
jgi:hypothetical protein